MNVLLLEDEAPAARRLERLLREAVPTLRVVGIQPSVTQAVEWVDSNPAPDLIIADIELADGRCFEFFRQRPPECAVIFTTAYDAFALQAFENNGVAYLLKPIEADKLKAAFDRLAKLRELPVAANLANQKDGLKALLEQMAPALNKAYRERFLLKFGDRYMPLQIKDVAYFTASDKVVFAVPLEGKKLPLDETLDELERDLDPRVFFRTSRGMLASRGSIRQISAHFNGRLKLSLQPDPLQEVFVSRDRAGAFRDWMNR